MDATLQIYEIRAIKRTDIISQMLLAKLDSSVDRVVEIVFMIKIYVQMLHYFKTILKHVHIDKYPLIEFTLRLVLYEIKLQYSFYVLRNESVDTQ